MQRYEEFGKFSTTINSLFSILNYFNIMVRVGKILLQKVSHLEFHETGVCAIGACIFLTFNDIFVHYKLYVMLWVVYQG